MCAVETRRQSSQNALSRFATARMTLGIPGDEDGSTTLPDLALSRPIVSSDGGGKWLRAAGLLCEKASC